jgi:hypothetical protein
MLRNEPYLRARATLPAEELSRAFPRHGYGFSVDVFSLAVLFSQLANKCADLQAYAPDGTRQRKADLFTLEVSVERSRCGCGCGS